MLNFGFTQEVQVDNIEGILRGVYAIRPELSEELILNPWRLKGLRLWITFYNNSDEVQAREYGVAKIAAGNQWIAGNLNGGLPGVGATYKDRVHTNPPKPWLWGDGPVGGSVEICTSEIMIDPRLNDHKMVEMCPGQLLAIAQDWLKDGIGTHNGLVVYLKDPDSTGFWIKSIEHNMMAWQPKLTATICMP